MDKGNKIVDRPRFGLGIENSKFSVMPISLSASMRTKPLLTIALPRYIILVAD